MRARRMLIVDDEEGIREVLRDFFEGEGFQVFEAVGGTSALERVQKERFAERDEVHPR